MSISTFLKTKKTSISLVIIIVVIANFIWLTSSNLGKSLNDILYGNFLMGVFIFVYILNGYRKWLKQFHTLRQALNNNERINEGMLDGEDFETKLIKAVIQSKDIELNEQTYELKKSIEEINDYIMKWVHEIKIPVTVCELVLERIDDVAMENELQTELERIKFLANQVLYISRAASYAEDLDIKEINLDRLVKNAIKRNATLMISKNIEAEVNNLNFTILSDEKWISYILDQLLNNAYKYMHKDGAIRVSGSLDKSGNVLLSVRDNGVGIVQKDLPRIFDKSFTGNNKSDLSKATGMGLYITKKMIDKLGHKIEVKSELNIFTEFIITFYRISDYRLNLTKSSS